VYNDYLHEDIDLEKTIKIWQCEDCGKFFEDDGNYDSYICPYCNSEYTTHEHMDIEKWKSISSNLDYEVYRK
jgi:rubrerythrin